MASSHMNSLESNAQSAFVKKISIHTTSCISKILRGSFTNPKHHAFYSNLI
jgi:hypothetical protein